MCSRCLIACLTLGLVAGLGLHACTTTTQTFEKQAPAAKPETPEKAANGAAGKASVEELLRQAGAEQDAGELDAAVATLERARTLASEDPEIWQRLAQVRLQQGESQQAERLALHSNELAGDDNLMRYLNWQIVAEARRQRGEEDSARQADEQARSLGS